MRPRDLAELFQASIRARQNVLTVSPPGCGKTAIGYQSIQATKAHGFWLYPSIGDPTDAKGMPWLYTNGDGKCKADFVPFDELASLYNALEAGELCVLVLDDLGQGTPATQASYMQLMDKLRGRCAVLAMTNDRTHRANVSGILEPIKSRFHTIVKFETSVQDWTEHLMDHFEEYGLDADTAGLGVAFLRHFRPELLHK
ncbi:MAG TPA: ATP-binding protein, partial [Candidatus Paceibacterota bacterium]